MARSIITEHIKAIMYSMQYGIPRVKTSKVILTTQELYNQWKIPH